MKLRNFLWDRRFLPLFICQFFSAFADNAFRSALVVMATYDQALLSGLDSRLVVSFIGLIFVLPFFLFSSLAGQIADKYEKSSLVKIIKGLEIIVILFSIYGFYSKSLLILGSSLFFSAIQSTFFGPLKYSLIPDYFKDNELVAVNGLIEASTFLAILLGSLIGGLLATLFEYRIALISFIMLSSVILSWLSSFYLNKVNPPDPNLKINLNIIQETIRLLRQGMRDRIIFLTIIGISWFWLVGGIFLAQITTYGKEIINGNENVATLFLVVFSLGISLGSAFCYFLMREEIGARLVPWGALGITLFTIDLVIASKGTRITNPEYIGILQFLSHFVGWRILIDLLMIAFSGGLYTVPLYALLQKESGAFECSRMIAVNNIANAFFMVISSFLSFLLLALGVSILTIFLIVGFINLIVMERISRLVPESILQLFLQTIFRIFFKAQIKGLENLQAAGDRVLIIANHSSFIDAALLFAFIQEKLSYAIYSFYIDKWWIRLISSGINLYPIDPANPIATKSLIEHLKQNKKCVIFPEGRITVTGSLMKIFDGPGMIADKSNAVILPIRIDGAQYSFFSRLKGKVRRKLFPKIKITILEPYCLVAPYHLKGRERRKVLSSQIYNMMTRMLFETSPYKSTLFSALINSGKLYGMNKDIVEDLNRDPHTYRQILRKVFILSSFLSSKTNYNENIGILLPNSIGALISFFSLQAISRIPAILNFSLSYKSVYHCCSIAHIKLIITSRKFVNTARLNFLIDDLSRSFSILYLEDIVNELGLLNKIKGTIQSIFPEICYNALSKKTSCEDTSVILFTSGSEGSPKAVALSHCNIHANHYQIASTVDLFQQDIVLNVLPMFHSFGLTVGTLLPLLAGVRTFLYPSPLHYRVIPIIAYDINSTLFFATDTFLNHYAKTAHPYDFYAIRYVFAGAEKLREETRQLWLEKFGINIFEGYGTTEASPVLAVNTRMYNKSNTVGRFLPAIQYRLEKIDGIDDGGRLYVKGPNIMKGYLNSEVDIIDQLPFTDNNRKKIVTNNQEKWYDTGDIVKVDKEGFVTILGRAKRFAKIGGEMISLVAVEEQLSLLYPEFRHVVLSFPDQKKGEQLILLTTASLSREIVMQDLKKIGFNDIMIPRRLLHIKEIPLLATGKIDLQAAKMLAETLLITHQ